MDRQPFTLRFRHAIEDGIILAVKYGLLLALVGWLLFDYVNVRQAAYFAAAAVSRPAAAPPAAGQ